MPSELAHRIDAGGSYPVLELTGALDVSRLRSVLFTVLADQPEGLIVDVTGLIVGDGDAGSAGLAEVARLNSEWPCTRIVLCDEPSGDAEQGAGRGVEQGAGQGVERGAGRSVERGAGQGVEQGAGQGVEQGAGQGVEQGGGRGAGRGAGFWRTAGVSLVADRDAAVAALGPAKPADRVRQDLEPIVGAARRAREMVTEACSEWGIPQVSGHGCIVVTEMVNNVVAHSQTPMTVLLGRHDGAVSIAVRDQSSVLPRYSGGPPAPTSYGGRGLLLIDSVARRWGHLEVPGGKVVWAVLGDEPEQ